MRFGEFTVRQLNMAETNDFRQQRMALFEGITEHLFGSLGVLFFTALHFGLKNLSIPTSDNPFALGLSEGKVRVEKRC